MSKEREAHFRIEIVGYVSGSEGFNVSDLDHILPSNYKCYHKGVSYDYTEAGVKKAKHRCGI